MKDVSRDSLLMRGYKNFRAACDLFYTHPDDPYYINMSAYHLQQSVEMTLKYEMEQNGIEFQKTHNITQLIQMIRASGADIDIPDFIDDASERFTVWEATARYELNNFVEFRKINDAIPHVRGFINDAIRLYDHDFWEQNIRNAGSVPYRMGKHEASDAGIKQDDGKKGATCRDIDKIITEKFIESEKDDVLDNDSFEEIDPEEQDQCTLTTDKNHESRDIGSSDASESNDDHDAEERKPQETSGNIEDIGSL